MFWMPTEFPVMAGSIMLNYNEFINTHQVSPHLIHSSP